MKVLHQFASGRRLRCFHALRSPKLSSPGVWIQASPRRIVFSTVDTRQSLHTLHPQDLRRAPKPRAEIPGLCPPSAHAWAQSDRSVFQPRHAQLHAILGSANALPVAQTPLRRFVLPPDAHRLSRPRGIVSPSPKSIAARFSLLTYLPPAFPLAQLGWYLQLPLHGPRISGSCWDRRNTKRASKKR